jgi:uncharacterized damage-inducible protein DinB
MHVQAKKLEDYRKGGIGALMDEYERAALELNLIVKNVSEGDYSKIADAETKNEDCRSIETIMNHVVSSGYEYANIIREQFLAPPEVFQIEQMALSEIAFEVDKMLAFTAESLDGKWELTNEEVDKLVTIMPWGTPYNLEQILEHAISHVLRHRRQIEKFLIVGKDEGELIGN